MDSSLFIGDEKIDGEHNNLLLLIDDLKNKVRSAVIPDSEEICGEIIKHFVFHFFDEESFMKLNNMPSDYVKKHMEDHQYYRVVFMKLSTSIDKIIENNDEKAILAALNNAISIFDSFIDNHIKIIDMEMKKYLNTKT